jgi:hypothetical protein
MGAHGKDVYIQTFTGGCGTDVVDVNPHITLERGEGQLTVEIALVDQNDRQILGSGVLLNDLGVYADLLVPITKVRWQARRSGGARVPVYVTWLRNLTIDTAQCVT